MRAVAGPNYRHVRALRDQRGVPWEPQVVVVRDQDDVKRAPDGDSADAQAVVASRDKKSRACHAVAEGTMPGIVNDEQTRRSP